MISVNDAIETVLREAAPIGSETSALNECVGRVLVEPIIADTDLPPFDRSQMDGYAVIAADTLSAPTELAVVGESAAGHGWHHELKTGNAVRIMTGAPVPKGADAVQKIELTSEIDELVTIKEPVQRAKNIVRKGSEIHAGEIVLHPGTVVTTKMIATLAAFGYSEVEVSASPRVGILSTGSEIVPVATTPGIDQIRNSNAPMLEAMSVSNGAKVKVYSLVHDEIGLIRKVISDAASECDILVITGGVSVGRYDLTKPALHDLGARIFFERVRLKPGKPTVFARLNDTLVFGLPGNPVSAAVTYALFVRTALASMQRASNAKLIEGKAILEKAVKAARSRETYLPSRLDTDELGRMIISPLKWHGSSDLVGFAEADSLIVLPEDTELSAGEIVNFVHI